MELSLDAPRPPDGIPPIDFRAQLNDEQYAAVTAPPGPLLVLAGAGSGKTRTLTYRVAYLLSQGVKPGEILLLTFTNKPVRRKRDGERAADDEAKKTRTRHPHRRGGAHLIEQPQGLGRVARLRRQRFIQHAQLGHRRGGGCDDVLFPVAP